MRSCNLPLVVRSFPHCLEWLTMYPDSTRELREIQKLHNNEYLGRDQNAGPNHRVRVGVKQPSATSTPTSGADKDNTKTDDPTDPRYAPELQTSLMYMHMPLAKIQRINHHTNAASLLSNSGWACP